MGEPNDSSTHQQHWQNCLPGTRVSLKIPARLEFLPILGAAVREYCATLPQLVSPNITINKEQRKQFGTGSLQLPGAYHRTVQSSFSHFVYSAELILQEAASNIIRHGYGVPDFDKFVDLELGTSKTVEAIGHPIQWAFLMELSDQAPPFDPTKVLWQPPDPLRPRESGYGLYLIQRLTTSFSYHYVNGRNYLQMLKSVDNFS